MSMIVQDIHGRSRAEARRRLAERLRDPDEDMGALKVRRLLRCLPGAGDEWVRRVLAHVGLSDQHVRSLTPLQRERLAKTVLLPLGALRPRDDPHAITPARLAAARRALEPYVAAPVAAQAARAALMAAASARHA
jgi:hypothetical protein